MTGGYEPVFKAVDFVGFVGWLQGSQCKVPGLHSVIICEYVQFETNLVGLSLSDVGKVRRCWSIAGKANPACRFSHQVLQHRLKRRQGPAPFGPTSIYMGPCSPNTSSFRVWSCPLLNRILSGFFCAGCCTCTLPRLRRRTFHSSRVSAACMFLVLWWRVPNCKFAVDLV